MLHPFSSIAGKLLWLAALNACAFVLIAVLVGVAFKRIGTQSAEIAIQEVAAVVVHLASDEAAFVTGQTFIIDGGWSL